MTPKKRQLLFFSATIPQKVRGLAKKHMEQPLSLTVREGKTVTLENIEQRIYMTSEEKKTDRLCTMLQEHNPYLAVVFCNTKERTKRLSGELIARGFNAAELQGDMSQGRRNQVIRDFARARTQILVASDIAARGIDIEGITHVYNYDVPHDVDYYVHRIGRPAPTARPGKKRIKQNIKGPITGGVNKEEGSGSRSLPLLYAVIDKLTADNRFFDTKIFTVEDDHIRLLPFFQRAQPVGHTESRGRIEARHSHGIRQRSARIDQEV